MSEIKISKIQSELQNPDSSDRLEISDMDGNSGDPQTKYIKVQNLAGDSVEYFDSAATYNETDRVLRSFTASDDGTYNNNVDDYRLYICQQDNTSGSWSNVRSNFQEVSFVLADSSIDGDGTPGNDLSVDIENVTFPGPNEDGITLDNVNTVLDLILDRFDIPVVADDNARAELDTSDEFRIIYNQKGTGTIDLSGAGQLEYYDHNNTTWNSFLLLDESKSGRLSPSSSKGIITSTEANRLFPSVEFVNSTTDFNQGYSFNNTTYDKYQFDESDNGTIFKFSDPDLGGLSNTILLEMPTSVQWDQGWHIFVILVEGNKNIHVAPEDLGTGNSLEPFNEVDVIPGYMSTIYNIRHGNSDNDWSVIGNIIDGT